MDLNPLGRSGLEVSALCMGTMAFGGEADEAEAGRMFQASRELGINFFDTADVYADGRSEEVLGRLIKGQRDKLVLASKCGMPQTGNPDSGRANRAQITNAIEASLQRLQTDYLDLYYMHRWDPKVPLEETLAALEELVRQGKVRALGASNYAAWQVAKALGISNCRGWPRFDVLQPMYNLVKRQAESEILPLALAEDLAVVTYSPVGGGLLSGKYGKTDKKGEGRITSNASYARRYGADWVFETAAAFAALAREEGVHPVTLAVAWVASHPAVTCPIIGARSLEQLRPSLEAGSFFLSPELRQAACALSRQPAPATDRHEELDQT